MAEVNWGDFKPAEATPAVNWDDFKPVATEAAPAKDAVVNWSDFKPATETASSAAQKPADPIEPSYVDPMTGIDPSGATAESTANYLPGSVMNNVPVQATSENRGATNPDLGPLRQDYVDSVRAKSLPEQIDIARDNPQAAKIAQQTTAKAQRMLAGDMLPATNQDVVDDANATFRNGYGIASNIAPDWTTNFHPQVLLSKISDLPGFGGSNSNDQADIAARAERARQLEDFQQQLSQKSWGDMAKGVGTAALDIAGGIPSFVVGSAAGPTVAVLSGDLHKGEEFGKYVMQSLTPSEVLSKLGYKLPTNSPYYEAAMLPFTVLNAGIEQTGQGYAEIAKLTGASPETQEKIKSTLNMAALAAMAAAGGQHGKEMIAPSEAVRVERPVNDLAAQQTHSSDVSTGQSAVLPQVDAAEVPPIKTATIADIAKATSVDEAIATAQASLPEIKPVETSVNDTAAKLQAIRPLPEIAEPVAEPVKSPAEIERFNEDTQAIGQALRGHQDAVVNQDGTVDFRGARVEPVAKEALPDHSTAGEHELSREQADAIGKLLELRGQKLVVYADHPNLPDGFVDPSDASRLFISNKTSRGADIVAGHELNHLMERTAPEAYKAYLDTVRQELKPSAMQDARAQHATAIGEDYVHREIGADIAGNAMRDPAFVSKVMDKIRARMGDEAAQPIARKLIDSLGKTITRIKELVKGGMFKNKAEGMDVAKAYINNLERVHDALADVYAQHFTESHIKNDVVPVEPEAVPTVNKPVEAGRLKAEIERLKATKTAKDFVAKPPEEKLVEPVVKPVEPVAKPAEQAQQTLFSEKRKGIESDDHLVNLYSDLAKHDEAFGLPHSKEKSLTGVLQDVAPRARIEDVSDTADIGEYSGNEDWKRVNKVSRVELDSDPKHFALVFETNDKRVWVDISQWKPGSSGTDIYQSIATYAHNNGKVFVGDPLGLSAEAAYRRLEQMISTSLRHGTTEHIRPGDRQIKADKLLGDQIRPISWKPNDHAHNLREMLTASHYNVMKAIPEIGDVSYNFDKRQFEAAPDSAVRARIASFRASHGEAAAPEVRDHAAAERESSVQSESGQGSDRSAAGRGVSGEADRTARDVVPSDPVLFSDADFKSLAESLHQRDVGGDPAAGGIAAQTLGVRTLKRGVLTDSILRSESSEGGRAILDRLSARSLQSLSPALKKVLYSEKRDNVEQEKQPAFYSQLARSIEQVPAKIDNGPATQWKLWLQSNAGKLGIKAEEIKWSGITDYLDLMGKQKISKEQIGEYLAQNGVKVTEVEKGGVDKIVTQSDIDAAERRGNWDEHDRLTRAYEDQQLGNNGNGTGNETKYAQYALPGGKNYRELLLTLPTKGADESGKPAKLTELPPEFGLIHNSHGPTDQQWGIIRNDQGHARFLFGKWGSKEEAIEMALPSIDYIREEAWRKKIDAENTGKTYKSSHWDEPNILAHIRFNDRTDAEGRTVLFIEELQSDWGQAGKKKGFADNAAKKRADEIDAEMGRMAGNRDPVTNAMREEGRWFKLAQERDDLLAKASGVPAAPFVTDTKAWLSLGLKRMIRYAAENGYDKVAFVNGEQSAARYDLSKQVKEIAVIPQSDGGRAVRIDPSDGISFKLMVDKGGNVSKGFYGAGQFTGKPLSDVVGKDMAERIMAATAEKSFSGEGLKVGGDGMKSFYDNIVPQTANDVLKKLGGGKVGDVQIQHDKFTVTRPDLDFGKDFQTKAEAEAYAEKHNGTVHAATIRPQSGFEITPSMREQAMQGQPLFSEKRAEHPAEEATGKLAQFLKQPKEMLTDLKLLTVPMAEGSDVARKMAKDYANQERKSQDQWKQFDEVLKKDFNEDQLRRMWEAADKENDLRREGKQSDTDGLNSLSPDERKVVETLHAYGEGLIARAKENGMFEGEGVPYWTPRMAVMVGENGEYSRPMAQGEGAGGETGRNITTSASSLKQRKYLTSAETEAAMKAKLDTGDKTAQLVRNIRTMPMAMARLERAIAGRELINQIKALGQSTGRDLVQSGAAEHGDGFFTLDHPAFKTWKPDFKDGEIRKDADGNPIMVQTPIKISNEFKGPLKSVMSTKPNQVYLGLMALKSKSMGLIMYSPLIHNAVEWGRAIPAMDTKGKLTLGVYTYVTGHAAKLNPEIRRDAIEHGLVPIGGRGQHMDITGVMDDPTMEVGRSWTAKALAAPVSIISEKGAINVKKAVDAAGKFWHETLLWERVADLQMGLYISMKGSLVHKGMAETDAARVAAYFANQYAGALPREAMSEGARQFLNLTLFSRTFTMGNLGAMKAMFAGLPKDVQAQIRLSSGELALQAAQSYARKKAIATFVIDIGLMYVANSMFQDWLEKQRGDKSWGQIADGYKERYGKLADKLKSDPAAVLAHPFNSLESLTSTGENEPGKEERIKWGEDSTGTNIYVRLPTGKIGEEFSNYANFPAGTMKQLKAKMSTFVKPLYETVTNDKGVGQKVYDDSKDASTAKNVGKVVVNFLKAQVPSDQILAAYDLATGHGDDMDVKKIVGPFVGLTFSKGAPGGPAVGEMYAASREHQDKVTGIMPDVKRALKLGDQDKAIELMESINMTPREINTTLNHIENPESRLSKGALRSFQKHATDEQKAKMDRQRQ